MEYDLLRISDRWNEWFAFNRLFLVVCFETACIRGMFNHKIVIPKGVNTSEKDGELSFGIALYDQLV